ncbi:MAG: hypothetical protein HC880_13285 [Bacteroidia bacterium]|nr:hypothetical protein [Bacteroidia bacterium]
MVLSNQEVYRLINYENLIEGADLSNVKNCSYTMKIGEVYEPDSGYVLDLEQAEAGRKRVNYVIRPSEVLIVKTKERINTPLNLCASYTALQSLASQGLLLINSSMVEPGYHGNLSCFIVNFSREDICFEKNADIVKLVFYQLDQEAKKTQFQTEYVEQIDEETYRQSMARKAIRFHRTFLDIERVEERASKRAYESIQRAVRWSGVFIALLLLWASLEPVITKWVYRASYQEDIVDRNQFLEKINTLTERNQRLENLIRDMQAQRDTSWLEINRKLEELQKKQTD